MTFAGDAIINSAFNGAPGDITFSGPVRLSNSTVGGSLRTITVNTSSYTQLQGGIVTISGVISDGASTYNGLVKAGAGTLRLTNANTYTGVTVISAGSIILTSDSNLGTNPYVNMNGGALAFWGTPGTNTFTTNKTLNFVAASSLDVSEGSILSQPVNSVWEGAAALQKVGPGTLVLQGDNSFNGLTIAGGIVKVSTNAQLGNTATPGVITFANVGPYGWGTAAVGMLEFTDNIANINRVVTPTAAGALFVDSGKTVTFTAAAGAGTINNVGAGTLQLTVTNGVATNWNANAGVLEVLNVASASVETETNL